MHETIKKMVHVFEKQREQRRRACAVFTALAILVSLTTTYMLVQPANTMAVDYVCGMEAHTHSEECYRLICDYADEAEKESFIEQDAEAEEPAPDAETPEEVLDNEETLGGDEGAEEPPVTEEPAEEEGPVEEPNAEEEPKVEEPVVAPEVEQPAEEEGEAEPEQMETPDYQEPPAETEQPVAPAPQETPVVVEKVETPVVQEAPAPVVEAAPAEPATPAVSETVTDSGSEAFSGTMSMAMVMYTNGPEAVPPSEPASENSDTTSAPIETPVEVPVVEAPVVEAPVVEEGSVEETPAVKETPVEAPTVEDVEETPVAEETAEEPEVTEEPADEELVEVPSDENIVEEDAIVEDNEQDVSSDTHAGDHVHTAACYELICDLPEHEHSEDCMSLMNLLEDLGELPEGYTNEYSVFGDGYTVAVFAPDGALPEGAELVATLLEEGDDAHATAQQTLEAMVAQEVEVNVAGVMSEAALEEAAASVYDDEVPVEPEETVEEEQQIPVEDTEPVEAEESAVIDEEEEEITEPVIEETAEEEPPVDPESVEEEPEIREEPVVEEGSVEAEVLTASLVHNDNAPVEEDQEGVAEIAAEVEEPEVVPEEEDLETEVIEEVTEETEDAVTEDSVPYEEEFSYDGFVALDIHFELDGEEIEPLKPVFVYIDIKGLLPESADPYSVAVQHHGETNAEENALIPEEETSSVAETVDMVADSNENTGVVKTTIDSVKALFAADSFSTFTVTWTETEIIEKEYVTPAPLMKFESEPELISTFSMRNRMMTASTFSMRNSDISLLSLEDEPMALTSTGTDEDERAEGLEIDKFVIDNGSGNFTLQLESFVTGNNGIFTQESVPADIVLVLDESGSMNDCIACGHETGNKCDSEKFEFDADTGKVSYGHLVYANAVNTSQVYRVLYKESNGKYSTRDLTWCTTCKAWFSSTKHSEHKPAGGGLYSWTPFEKKGETPDYSRNDGDGYHVQFYCYCTSHETQRMGALKSAVTSFLAQLRTDAIGDPDTTEDDVKHRVAVIGYDNDGYFRLYSANDDGAEEQINTGTLLDGTTDQGYNYTDSTWLNTVRSDMVNIEKKAEKGNVSGSTRTKVDALQNAFRNVWESNDWNVLGKSVNNVKVRSATATHQGMLGAKLVLKHAPAVTADTIDENGNPIRNKVVILFTDGSPGSGYWNHQGWADALIGYANTIKDSATVYTVGLYPGANASTSSLPEYKLNHTGEGTSSAPQFYANGNRVLHLTSSNYPDAESLKTTGSLTDLKAGEGYYLATEDQQGLNNIFNQLANIVTPGSTSTQLDEFTVVRDIVTTNFKITNPDLVTAWTEDFIGYEEDGVTRKWGTTKTYFNPEDIVVKGNTVDVSGFDYAENFVHVDKDKNNNPVYLGKRVVVNIPIVASETNPGGSMQTTNTTESGIYVPYNNDPIKKFPMPYVDTPVTVTVKKIVTGSDTTDSFSFKASYTQLKRYEETDVYAPYEEVDSSNWLYADEEEQDTVIVVRGEDFELADEESKSFDVLYNSQFSVGEINVPAGYAVSITADGQLVTADRNGNYIFTAEKDVEIVFTNHTGPELPSTGGIGTNHFTTLGIVLMLGAGVLLLDQRRRREGTSVS